MPWHQPWKRFGPMSKRGSEPASRTRVLQFGGREVIVAEGQRLGFLADISHRCMTASWPSFIGGAVLIFIVFNAIFAVFYWIGHQPISNVPGGAYIEMDSSDLSELGGAGF